MEIMRFTLKIVLNLFFVFAIITDVCQGQNAVSNLLSTIKIVTRLCYFPHVNSEKVARGFIGCYDNAPGKWQYFTCMKQVNGHLLDTKEHIESAACKRPWRTPSYIQCLMKEFKKANLDLNKATAKVNDCQSRVVGVY